MTSFDTLGLDERLLESVRKQGFEAPTPIQDKAIPHLMNGFDLMGLAQTGGGKTAAFVLPMLHQLLAEDKRTQANKPRAIILAPTRELALQIAKDADGLAKFTDLNIVTVLGGVDYDKQKQQLMNEVVDIVVATPGRLLDYLQQKIVYLDHKLEHVYWDGHTLRVIDFNSSKQQF